MQGEQGGIQSACGLQPSGHHRFGLVAVNHGTVDGFQAVGDLDRVLVFDGPATALRGLHHAAAAAELPHLPAAPRHTGIDLCFFALGNISVGVQQVFFQRVAFVGLEVNYILSLDIFLQLNHQAFLLVWDWNKKF